MYENKKKKSKNETKICSKVKQELFMNAIKNTFIINKVDQNGHCGYIAIINGLKEYDINHESATEFRELIHDHINENKSSIYDNMKFSTPISKNNFISTVSRCIYHESMNDNYTSSDHWMDTSKVISIICHIYKELTFLYMTQRCVPHLLGNIMV